MIKYSGAGNTFIITLGKPFTDKNRASLARDWCDPIRGVNADGALFLDVGTNGAHWNWDFYNSDGTQAEMCGNASRSATQFVYEELAYNEAQVIFQTKAGLIRSCRVGALFEVEMPVYKILQQKESIHLPGHGILVGARLDTGVPHFVVEVPLDGGYQQYSQIARAVREHVSFQPKGTNATLIDSRDPKRVRAVTFERGVEGFTLACGTGAVAAAVVSSLTTEKKEVDILMPGGELKIILRDNWGAIMVGPSEKIAEIKWIRGL